MPLIVMFLHLCEYRVVAAAPTAVELITFNSKRCLEIFNWESLLILWLLLIVVSRRYVEWEIGEHLLLLQ